MLERCGWLTLAVTLLVALFAAPVSAVELVRDSKPAATIVVPDDAWEVVRQAATELRHHVELASGAALPIVSESQLLSDIGPAVYLGPTKAAAAQGIDGQSRTANGFIAKSVGDNLFIAGHDAEGHWLNDNRDAGTLFGVFDLLDRELGVRWLWPGDGGVYVPKQRTIVLKAIDRAHDPQLLHTRLRQGIGSGQAGWSTPKARENYVSAELAWLRRNRIGRAVSLEYDHGFTNYWKQFRDRHPDFFNMLPDGTRRPDPTYFAGAGTLVSMCVSSPRLHQQIVSAWLEKRTDEKPWLDCAENDTVGKCVCERCLSWDPPTPGRSLDRAKELFETNKPSDGGPVEQRWYHHLGSLSDRYAKFCLAVQKLAEKHDSSATVLGYAYANYCEPPIETKLNDRIVLGVVPNLTYPWTQEKRDEFRKQWQGWADTGAKLYLRPNYTLDGHNMPIFYADRLADDFRFAHERGMIGTDFDSLTGQWSTQGPNLYVLVRMQQRPELSADEMLDEYYSAFGSAKEQVQAYFNHWRGVSSKRTNDIYRAAERRGTPDAGTYHNFYRTGPVIFTPAVLAEGRKLLAAAIAVAQSDADATKRVAFLEKGLRNVELTLAAQLAFEEFNRTGESAGLKQALQTLDDFRTSVEGEFIANMAFLRWAENYTWNREKLKDG